MNINIILQTTNDPTITEDTANLNRLVVKLYDNLRGNQDYVDNGILLNYNEYRENFETFCGRENKNDITLIFGFEDCKDKYMALELLKKNMETIYETIKPLILNL